LIETDEDGSIVQTFINKSFCRILGFTEEEYYQKFFGDKVTTILNQADLAIVKDYIRRAKKGLNEGSFIFSIPSPDGSTKYFMMSASVKERHGRKITFYCCIWDITEKIRFEKELEKSKKEAIDSDLKQKELFNNNPCGILDFEYDGTYLHFFSANNSFLSMIGYTQEEFASKEKWIISELVPTNDLQGVRNRRINPKIGIGQSYQLHIFNRKTNETVLYECNYRIKEISKGSLKVLANFLNKDAERKAEEANAATTQFLSRMSHDMRTPMNGILGIAELSKDVTDIETLKSNISKIQESGQYLLGLINDTLDFQKIKSGKLVLETEISSLSKTISNVLDMVSTTANKKGVSLNSSITGCPDNLLIKADTLRLKQILINLLSNAIKFTPEGGSVNFAFHKISQDENILNSLITISDTGLGMSKDFIESRIFKPFEQEKNSASNQYAGSGLGLSIAKSLVLLMGGTIDVASELGEGTTFSIHLSFETVDSKEASDISVKNFNYQEEILQVLKNKKILLIEDHPLNAEIATKLLERKGCLITWEQNGLKGLENFSASKPNYYDAILMDIRMPEMNGLESAAAIRKLNRADSQSIPIIAMTANAFDTDIKEALSCGMNAHLSKPISPKILYETLAGFFIK